MPQTIGELINNLAQKAGIQADNAELKTLLSSPELANINVPDVLVTTIDGGLLSLDAAKNNHPDIKKKYFADAYDGMDKQLIALVANDTFDQADLDEIKAEKSTSKKAELIVAKLKAAKANAKGADKDEINRQLAAANETARLAKAEVETKVTEYEAKIKTIYKDAALTSAISNYKTIYDELPGKAKVTAMKAVIDEALQDKNAILSVDDNGNLLLTSKDGTNVFGPNNVQLTPTSFLDQTFAPILKVTPSGPPKPAATRPAAQPNGTLPDDKTEVIVSQIKSHADKVIEDMSKQAAPML